MKRLLLFLTIFLNVVVLQAQDIIPQPLSLVKGEGFFTVNHKTVIVAARGLETRAMFFRDLLKPAMGFEIPVIEKPVRENYISLVADASLGAEAYQLEVTKNHITVKAGNEQGIFWGLQTLRQLLPLDVLREAPVQTSWTIPVVKINDKPQFKWRGLMLDVSRTFMNKEQVKKYIDALSYFKLNVLHMHLTDDQGWRLEIKKYPLLTEKASRFDTSFHEPPEYEGYYTQADMKELIAYAALRNVEIVPEIEMPGHSSEVFAAYPELSCKGDTLKIHPWTKGYGVHKDVFCAGNDDTFKFLEAVLDEVVQLFPSKFVHVGADEVPKEFWKNCPKCQKRIKDEGLKDENELQSWTVRRMEKYLNSKGKKLVGWDEILEGGLSKSATVMYWRGWLKDIPAKVLEQGNDMIMSPTTHFYIDYTNEKISTQRVYSYQAPFMDGKGAEKILGVQVNFWSHLDRTVPRIDRQLFPRVIALAEVGWSQQATRNWEEFKPRLQSKLHVLDIMGIYYMKDYLQ
ncbi:MAG TPA: beta-N-acetylhexosaminidase [Chitinophagaceae bacterium]|nr:beta-N-acetylhexosaminidase [Chitinophagaceae bacterium]